MADPTPLLSTITGASAGLVAIIGGLLVARYVGLDSEQQGAQQRLDDAKDRLDRAEETHREAHQALIDYDLVEFTTDRDVAGAIIRGVTDADALKVIYGGEIAAPDEELRLFIGGMRREAEKYLSTTKQLIEERRGELSSDEQRDIADQIAKEAGFPEVWEAAYDRSLEEYLEKQKTKSSEKGLTIKVAPAWLKGFNEQNAKLVAGFTKASDIGLVRPMFPGPDYRSPLVSEVDHAEQAVEDVRNERDRLKEIRDKIGRPKGLWPVLAVLAYGSIVSIVLPVLKMMTAPTRFDWQITWLVWLFVSSLAALLVLLVWQAIRLSRRLRR